MIHSPVLKFILILGYFVDNYTAMESVQGNQLFVLTIHGFRWDCISLQSGSLPGFEGLHSRGVKAKWVEPIFPTEAYPNWATLSTGVYAETHGILDNFMVDQATGKAFELTNFTSTKEEIWWQNVEPIWTTATKMGKRVATVNWGSSDVPFHNITVKDSSGYDIFGNSNITNIFDKSLTKLNEGYDLIMSFIPEQNLVDVDCEPICEEILEQVRTVDRELQNFSDKLKKLGLENKVNVIVVSERGMSFIGNQVANPRVPLEDFLDLDNIDTIIGSTVLVSLLTLPNKTEQVYEKLKAIKDKGVDVYKKEDIPERYHYRNNERTADIIIVAREGKLLAPVNFSKQIPPYDSEGYMSAGSFYGFDPSVTDMRTIFIAAGPDFKCNYINGPISTVDIYQLFPYLLGLNAEPNNGT